MEKNKLQSLWKKRSKTSPFKVLITSGDRKITLDLNRFDVSFGSNDLHLYTKGFIALVDSVPYNRIAMG